MEVFFVHRKSEEYNALISLMGLNSAGSPVNISFLAAKDMGVLIDTYKYVENVLKIYKKKKIKILLLEKEKETKILNFINSVGFFEEAFLKKENNNQDIYLYSKLLEMNSSD
ncbi:MAG: hypothetical protein PHX16_03545 [Syntrophaceticus sp.]|nr:hypothetical protein [Syntrophaceticus sp.]MDD4360170.1 hypothetical protein [Syntrophaceticus sp.]MDD4782707.1 hypothetical protein [Syntrophaceticus sp.]